MRCGAIGCDEPPDWVIVGGCVRHLHVSEWYRCEEHYLRTRIWLCPKCINQVRICDDIVEEPYKERCFLCEMRPVSRDGYCNDCLASLGV